ncbi:MAG: hypothetical protein DRP64_18135, partial [Verrucomicrobia bacterium]
VALPLSYAGSKGTANYANIAVEVNTPDSIFPFSALTYEWMRFAQSQVDRENKNQSKARSLPVWERVR